MSHSSEFRLDIYGKLNLDAAALQHASKLRAGDKTWQQSTRTRRSRRRRRRSHRWFNFFMNRASTTCGQNGGQRRSSIRLQHLDMRDVGPVSAPCARFGGLDSSPVGQESMPCEKTCIQTPCHPLRSCGHGQ